ncbi:MAG: SDR family oxidoreductase [Kangiellaceae bacterium]|nr:SDR family oxidoreductase [Kangiellaceae bacterium]
MTTFSNDALKGRKAVIFAGSKGLGKASALQLAQMGASLVLLARNLESLEQTRNEINALHGVLVEIEVLDITDEKALSSCLQRHDNADILVTNCGGPPVKPFESLALSDWDDAYKMIVRSVLIGSRVLVPAMAARGWGRVVMITSSVVVDPMRNFSVSNALRKSLLGLAESLAEEYADKGVAANIVCPGLTKTARTDDIVDSIVERTGKNVQTITQQMIEPIAVKRMAAPEEIAAAVGFLCCEQAGFIQGHALLIDGGQAVNPN